MWRRVSLWARFSPACKMGEVNRMNREMEGQSYQQWQVLGGTGRYQTPVGQACHTHRRSEESDVYPK